MCDIDPAAATDPAIEGGENLSRWVSGEIRRSPRQLLHPHQWLRKMVAHRIADPTILEVIGKWLKTAAMVDGALSKKVRNSIAGSIVTKVPCSLEIASVSRRSAPARSRAAPAGISHLQGPTYGAHRDQWDRVGSSYAASDPKTLSELLT